MTDYLRYSK